MTDDLAVGTTRDLLILVYVYPEHRANAPTAFVDNPLRLDVGAGDKLLLGVDGGPDRVFLKKNAAENRKHDCKITVPAGWLWREEGVLKSVWTGTQWVNEGTPVAKKSPPA